MTNCINCGMPIELDLDKCLYCGTSYFDISSIDFDSKKPIALKFKYGNLVMMQLAIPSLDIIENSCESVDCCGGIHNTSYYGYVINRHINTKVNFEAIPDEYGTLFRIIEEK